MQFFYVRPTKLRPKADQLAVLSGEPDEWYIDEKPKRGEPDWFWWEKLTRACRPGEGDEVHVSHASVIADSVPIALKRLGDLTAREAVLVIVSTGKRYSWHPAAADAIGLAMEMASEARSLVGKIGGEAFAKKAAAKRGREAKKLAEAERLWLDVSVPVDDVYRQTGMTRNQLNKRFGPSGRPRFRRGP